MIDEAVKIGNQGSMNSKAEWLGYRVARLTVEMTDKETKESIKVGEGVDKKEKAEIEALLDRVANASSPSTVANLNFDSRKRSGAEMAESDAKRSKAAAVANCDKPSEVAKESEDLQASVSLNETYMIHSPLPRNGGVRSANSPQ